MSLWKCSPRNARLSEAACAAMHERALERVSRKPGRYATEPIFLSDRACAVCQGVRWRFDQGLEKPPGEIPELVRPARHFTTGSSGGYTTRTRSTRAPMAEIKCSSCDLVFMPKMHKQEYCSHTCKERERKRRRAARRMVEKKCKGCGVSIEGRPAYCTDQCQREAKNARVRERCLKKPKMCVVCNATIQNRIQSAKYCSETCRRSKSGWVQKMAQPSACESCGVAFMPTRPDMRFCSKKCGQNHWTQARRKAPATIMCKRCGKAVENTRGQSKFCSDPCRSRFWTERVRGSGKR